MESRLERINQLDGWRGASIAIVILSHVTIVNGFIDTRLSWIIDGTLGVRIFFVISGFIISTKLISEYERTGRCDPARFYKRRVLRLFPVILAFALAMLIIDVSAIAHVSRCSLFTTVFYMKNIACVTTDSNFPLTVDGHLWSLAVESQFYLLVPFLLPAAIRQGRRIQLVILSVLCLTAVLSRAIDYRMGSRIFVSLMSNLDFLSIGIALSFFMRHSSFRKRTVFVASLQDFTALTFVFCVPLFSYNLLVGWYTVTIGPTLQAAAVAFLIGRTIAGVSCLTVIMKNRALVGLGLISYSVYVWQQLFMASSGPFGVLAPQIVNLCASLLLPILAGSISYAILEKPFNKLRAEYDWSARKRPLPDGR